MGNKRFVLLGMALFILIGLISCGKKSTSTTPNTNNPPTVTLTASPNSGNAPLTIQFIANAQDSDGSIVKYEWNFDGDNNYDSTTTVNTASYEYTSNGTYNPKVRVTDNGEATAEATTSISVTIQVTPPPVKTISFAPSGNPANNSVYLSQASTNNDEITLNINVKGVTNVHGTAIEITFDGSKISYISASEGNFLNQDGTNTIFTAGLEQDQNGVLLLGVDRTGYVGGVSGDGVSATIVLKALTTQTNTPIDFNVTNSAIKLPSNGGSIVGVSWLGGNLSYE